MRQQHRWKAQAVRLMAAAASASLAGGLCVLGGNAPSLAAAPRSAAAHVGARLVASSGASCHLGNGVQHVVQITFDNVHYYRDNPNVPSDLQMLPSLLHYIQGNGTLLTNNHTPLIAHTANDLLTTFTGLYGDRAGMPVSNSYQTYNPSGTTDKAGSFAYWTDPIFDTTSPPTAGHDTNPGLVYSPTPPATTTPAPKPDKVTPAPWVPFTRAGCDVGQVATVNQVLENTAVDIPKVFGPSSPEAQQLAADKDQFKDAEVADYVGVGVHCAQGSAFCANAQGVKFGQTTPSHTAVADLLPDEPGGYTGYQGLFGHRYVAPQLGAGTPNVSRHGFQVTNSAGNLVDLAGNQINGAFLASPGFPGFSNIDAAQSLAYTADMLESGVPVVNTYISDLHGNHFIPGLSACTSAPDALGSGSACYIQQAQYYNRAFGQFFKRLAADGITTQNTLFMVTSDEGDHMAGANVGRALHPTPTTCDGAKVSGNTVTPDVLCSYPAGTFGELAGNLTGLLATQAHNTTPFSLQSDAAPEFYVTGNPGPGTPQVRTLERDVAKLTATNPYTGKSQKIDNYLANPTEEAILHMVNADPARTPTFAMFAKPDYFLTPGPPTCSGSCVQQDTGFAFNHGDYAAEINTNFVGFAGPGVQHLGVDGNRADAGPSSAGANSGQVTVAQTHLAGPWTDETDIRPTILALAGLQDDYQHDGRVITQILSHPNGALSAPGVTRLGECYKQLNASVGDFGAATLIAATHAMVSTSAGDKVYQHVDARLRRLEVRRDRLAGKIKGELEAAAFGDIHVGHVQAQISRCKAVIGQAAKLAAVR